MKNTQLKMTRQVVIEHLEFLERLFVPEMQLTFVARLPGNPG